MPKRPQFPPLDDQTRTLFLPSPGTRGILVQQKAGKRVAVARRFPGSGAAMAWCESTKTALVYWPTHPARDN